MKEEDQWSFKIEGNKLEKPKKGGLYNLKGQNNFKEIIFGNNAKKRFCSETHIINCSGVFFCLLFFDKFICFFTQNFS